MRQGKVILACLAAVMLAGLASCQPAISQNPAATQPGNINVYLTVQIQPGAVVLQVQPGAVEVGGVGPITVNASLLSKALTTRPATGPAQGE